MQRAGICIHTHRKLINVINSSHMRLQAVMLTLQTHSLNWRLVTLTGTTPTVAKISVILIILRLFGAINFGQSGRSVCSLYYQWDPGQRAWPAARMSSICRLVWLRGSGRVDGGTGQQLFSLLLVNSVSYTQVNKFNL